MSELQKNKQITLPFLLIGPPNVGKSTIFNRLTTSVALVSNIDRMTTEHTIGTLKQDRYTNLVDLPGIYNLSHPIAEENEVSYHLVNHKIKGIVNVIAAKSLQRDLYLTIQALETGLLNTLIINMIDTINVSSFDWKKLSKKLKNLNIILTQSNKGVNIDKIVESIKRNKTIDAKIVTYSSEIESLITKIVKILPNQCFVSKRFHAIMLLEGNDYFHQHYKTNYAQIYSKLCKIFDCRKCEKYASIIHDYKVKFINVILKKCHFNNEKFLAKKEIKNKKNFDSYFFKSWVGFPLFFIVITLIYYLAFGEYAGGWLQSQFGQWLTNIVAGEWCNNLFSNILHAPNWCCSLLVNGFIMGIFLILPFLISIVILYICFSILQQTGFLARISILFDWLLCKFGISGRSIVTLVTGFGCTVPAILLAKSSSSKKERLIATLITPFCACTTRVIVIAAISSVIFINFSWLVTYGFILFSGILALLLGLFFSKTLFRKEKSFFCVEMVQWTNLDLKIIVKTTWLKVKEFLKRSLFIIASFNVLIWLLVHIGPFGYCDNNITQSFLYFISYGLSYLNFLFLGIYGNDSWKYSACLLAAIPTKEIVLGTIQNINNGISQNDAIKNLFINDSTLIAIANLRTISFLTFFLFYTPCLPTLSTIHSSVGIKSTLTNIISSLLVALFLSSLIYWIGFGIINCI